MAGETEYRIQVAGQEVIYSDVRDEFIQSLKTILEEIFNPDIPFVQCENSQACRYCPFTGICSR
ncbi:MAG: PD-(D/E)XK nuclease family protein [Bacteroidales bacterium]|nr:PD-(D/E)XK nuclease family protein [Bacteroidales bacterium]